jgi:8-oxo-dGTP diphosphatase
MQKFRLKNAEIEKRTHLEFFRIALSVDCVIFGYDKKKLKVLVFESDFEEYANMWSLIGDLVQPEEDLEEAPYRILRERAGLHDVYMEQVYTFGSVERHPSGRVITTAYYSLVDIKTHKLPPSETNLHWHDVDHIHEMAFDHKMILDTCLTRLREKVLEHPIVFNLLPEKFSLRELQDLYEAILGVELDRRNFRKRITLKNWLVDLNEMEEDVPHRPGKLYKLKNQLKSNGKNLKTKSQKLVI